jgi:hypothetical protein
LLRTLVAKNGVYFSNRDNYPIAINIEDVLNQIKWKGKGREGVPAATVALIKLETELQKAYPSIDIKKNIKW